jgi:hypothetical protein
MPYPTWLNWDNIDHREPAKHFRKPDGFPACGCYIDRYPIASCTTNDPHKVTCGRCLATYALYKVS